MKTQRPNLKSLKSLLAKHLLAALMLTALPASFAAAAPSCESIFELSHEEYQYSNLNQDPFVVHNTFFARLTKQSQQHPERPYGFSTKGVLDQQAKQLRLNLEDLEQRLRADRVDDRLLKYCAKAIKFAKATERTLAYDDILVLSYWHSLLMTVPVISATSFINYKFEKLERAMLSPRKAFDYRFRSEHPKFGFYIPDLGVAKELDLVRNRSAFLYNLGLTRQFEYADGFKFDPDNFFDHDMNHAARARNSDAYNMRDLTEEGLAAHYRLRFEATKFIDRIFADPKISTVLKEFYKTRLFLVDHEGPSYSIVNKELYLRVLMTYFVDRPEVILEDVYIYGDFSASNPDKSWANQQANDFKHLYSHYPEFREFWKRAKRDYFVSNEIFRK